MTNTDNGLSATESRSLPRAEPDAALAAARQLLADTAELITPAMPASELLTWLKRYRAHIAALVAVRSTSAFAGPHDRKRDTA